MQSSLLVWAKVKNSKALKNFSPTRDSGNLAFGFLFYFSLAGVVRFEMEVLLEGTDVLSDMPWMHSKDNRHFPSILGEMERWLVSLVDFLEEVTSSCTLFLLVSFDCLSFGPSRVLWTIRENLLFL